VADWRRYFSPSQNLAVAVRGLHMSRYGVIENEQAIPPWFLGGGNYVRGYSLESFQPFECPPPPLDPSGLPLPPRPQEEGCPTFARLVGHRLAVANLELRVPVLGFDHYGLFRFPWLPTELVFFGDAGLAWDKNHPPTLELSRSALERVPVFSTGVSARFNVAGIFVLEAYHAYPFQRPGRGSHWGFLVSPGW
jgi:outer membrane protein assembly factor BamA